MLRFYLAQRIHLHILSHAPLCAGDVFQPGRSQEETGLTNLAGCEDDNFEVIDFSRQGLLFPSS